MAFKDVVKNFKEAYKKTQRNKYGRWGNEKPIAIIKCLNCNKKTEKQNPKQKYCKKCSIKLNIGHKMKKIMKNDTKRYIPIM